MGGSELSVRHFSAVGGGAAFPPLLSVVLWGRRMGRRGRHCTWWPRRPGTLPCLPLHFRTRLRGPGGSPSGAGGRARCDSARLAMTRFCHFFRRTQFFFKSFCSGLFREGLRRAPFSVAAAYIVLPPSFIPASRWRRVWRAEGEGSGIRGHVPSPAPLRELRLFWKLLERGAPPWCPDAGAKGGCAVAPPPRVVDACPAVTRVGPAD